MSLGLRRGLIAAATTLSVLVVGIPAPAMGGALPVRDGAILPISEAATPTNPAEQKVSLQDAISIARTAYPDTANYDQFSSDYSEYRGKGTWILRWNSTKGDGNCTVSVSALTGNIVNLDIYRESKPGRYHGLPAFTRAQAQARAEAMARQVLPAYFTQCKLMPPNPWELRETFPLRNRTYPVTYSFTFARTEHGIPVNGSAINVSVNAETGDVRGISMSWPEDLVVPDPTGRLTTDDARSIFIDKGFELAYAYFGPHDRDAGVRPQLVYQQRYPTFLLDALSGDIIDPENSPYYYDMAYGLGGMGANESARAKEEAPQLSDVEAEDVAKLAGLLTAEEAFARARDAYRLPSGMKLESRYLVTNWDVPGARLWDFNCVGTDQNSHVSLRVDAKTGELLSFSTYEKAEPLGDGKAPAVNYTMERARKVAENFIKRQQPERFKEIIYRGSTQEMGPWIKEGERVPRAYYFDFARVVNGVPYPANGFALNVNANTGEVTAYAMRWWDTAFPAPEGLITKDDAAGKFLTRHPLNMGYARAYARYAEGPDIPEYRLLYQLAPSLQLGVIDARTGQEIDGEGKPIAQQGSAFTDIAGHPAAKEIQLLADQGLVTSKDGRFRPNEVITSGELVAMLVAADSNLSGYRNEEDPDRLADLAVALGLVEKAADFKTTQPVNRLQAARWVVTAQGLGALARHQEAFYLRAADAKQIPQIDRGFVAAALTLDYLDLQKGGVFNPGAKVTRGDAAVMLVRALLTR